MWGWCLKFPQVWALTGSDSWSSGRNSPLKMWQQALGFGLGCKYSMVSVLGGLGDWAEGTRNTRMPLHFVLGLCVHPLS